MARELIAGPHGAIEVLASGHGDPVTVFGHGFGASIASTRPYASGVPGTRVFMHFRSHGRTAVALKEWTYPELAEELLTVADAVGATQALGVSMGAGAILSILLNDPSRFERVVLALPAAVDEARDSAGTQRYEQLAGAVERGGLSTVRALLEAELPPSAREGEAAQAWLDQQVEAFSAPGMVDGLRSIPRAVPVPDVAALQRLTLPVLILAQEGDDVHPVSSAERLAQYLPNAELHVMSEAGLLWGHRDEVRELVSSFLTPNADA